METILPILWIIFEVICLIILVGITFMGICVVIIALFPTASFDAMMRSDDEEKENKHYE